MRKSNRKIIFKALSLSLIFSILVWIIDAIIDYMFFYEGTFLELLFLKVPTHEIYVRSVFALSIFIFGYINSLNLIRLKRYNQKLQQSNEQIDANNQQLYASEQQLIASNQQLQASEAELTKKAYDLEERMKELRGLYQINESIWKHKSLDDLMEDAINIIPSSWQYPDITQCRIIYNKKEFLSNHFSESQWIQSSPIIADQKFAGKIEVFYTQEMPLLDEGPFMREERELLDNFAKTLGRAIERQQYHQQFEFERAQLKLHEKQFKAIFNGIDDIMYVADPITYDLVHANDIAMNLYGEDIIGKKCYEAFHGKSEVCHFCTNKEIFGDNIGKTYIWETKNESNNRWFRCSDKAIQWSDGRMLRFELATDITEIVKLNEELLANNQQLIANEQQLKASEQQLKAINEELIKKEKIQEDLKLRIQLANNSAKIGVWDLDLVNNTLIWDEWMYKLYDIDPKDFGGAYEAWQKGVHPDDLEQASKEVDLAVSGQKEFDSEFRIITPKGEIRYLKAFATVIKDHQGKPIKMIGVNYDITPIKTITAELLKNEKRYLQAEKIAKVGSWEYNVESTHFWGSDEAKRIYGFNPKSKDFTTEQVENCIPEKERVHQALIDLIEFGKAYDLKFEIITKDTGETRFIRSKAELEKDNKGEAIRVNGVILDITEQRKNKQLIKESDERFKLAMMASTDGNWDWDIKTNKVYYSPAWKRILNIDQIDENLATWENRLHPEEKDAVLKSIEEHLYGKTNSWEMEHRLQLPDKTYKWVLGKGKVVERDHLKNPTRMVGSMTDIQKRKEDELKLIQAIKIAEENEFRFKSLHNASFGGITIHDKGLILDCNYGLSQITGYSHEELIGMDGLLLISEDTRDLVMANIMAKYEKPYEAKGLRKNGETYPLRLEAREIPYKNKKVRVVEFRDITDQKKIEEQLVLAKKKAEESDQLKSAFLANMSHEIRTPMNGILGFTSLLEEPDITSDEFTHYVEIIKRSGFRMLDTVNDIIDISKIDSGQMEVNISKVDISYEINSLYEFFLPEAAKKGIALHLDNRLDKSTPALLNSDQNKITSIITNLIKNAIKYTDSGEINIIVEKQKNTVKCSVKDTGIGIPSEKLNSIFNRFVQADIKDARAYEGAGLGLSITKSYVEMLHGKISVTSVENKGSCFTFTLPISTP